MLNIFFEINKLFFRYQTQNLPNPFKPNLNELEEISIASSLKTFNLNHIIIKFLFLLVFGYKLYNILLS